MHKKLQNRTGQGRGPRLLSPYAVVIETNVCSDSHWPLAILVPGPFPQPIAIVEVVATWTCGPWHSILHHGGCGCAGNMRRWDSGTLDSPAGAPSPPCRPRGFLGIEGGGGALLFYTGPRGLRMLA